MKRVIASLFVAVPLLVSGCNTGPLEGEELAPEAQEVAEVAQGVIVLQGQGVLFDNSHGRVSYTVEDLPNGDKTKARFVLQAASHITWWKSLDIFTTTGSSTVQVARIETKDSRREVSVDYASGQMQDSYRVELWKAGAFNVGVKAFTMELGRSTTEGKKLTFRWERD